MLKKLKSRAGLTLTELLITMLILSLFSSACIVGISTALRARQDNIKANDADILASMVTQIITDELRLCEGVTQNNENEISYASHASEIAKARLYLNADGQLYMDIGTAGNSFPLLSDAAYIVNDERFTLHLEDLKFTPDTDAGTITVEFKVCDSNNTLVDQSFTVNPLNSIS